VLSSAAAGHPGVVIVEGEAGMGKTALVHRLIAGRGPGMRLLFASGAEAEQRLDLGVVEQLYDDARALGLDADTPFGRSDARPDPLDVGAALLQLLDLAAADGPLLVVVDDAQWADPPSLQALTFAVRRLRSQPVLVVVVQRPSAERMEPLRRLVSDGGGALLRLERLSARDVRDLVEQRRGIALAARAAARVHRHTRGVPLDVVTVVDELQPDVLRSGIGPLPAPRSYASVMLARLEACPVELARLVHAVAVAGIPVPFGRLAAMVGVDDADELARSVAAGVERELLQVELRAGVTVIDVAHPLLRSAVLFALPAVDRAELHRLAAEIATDDTRRMLHLIGACIGEDPVLGREAVGMAHRRLREGWEMSAVEVMVAARRLFPPGDEQDEVALRAVDALLRVGDLDTATELLGSIRSDRERPFDLLVRGHLAFLAGDARAALTSLRSAWRSDPEPWLAARVGVLLATLAANLADGEKALRWARRALDARSDDHSTAGQALTMLATSSALAGDLEGGLAEIRRWRDAAAPEPQHDHSLLPLGLVLMWDGRLAEARRVLEESEEVLRRHGPPLMLATARYSLADLLYRIGEWDEALGLAERLASTLDDAGLPMASPIAHSIAAFLLGARGDRSGANRHLADSARVLGEVDNPSVLLWHSVAVARVADAANDRAAVVEELLPLAELTAGLSLVEGVQPWRADLVEALVALDRLAEAEVQVAALVDRARGGGPHVRVDVARARGVLAAAQGDDGRAAAAFRSGLAEDADAPGAFARARLELAAGAFHRRRGARREAAALLDAARGRFEALGARPYAARAARELEACGLRPRPRRRGGGDPSLLTASEQAVAELVAAGRKNREVAAELVVSVKTVETHLANVYAKLGIRSRTELARVWRTE